VFINVQTIGYNKFFIVVFFIYNEMEKERTQLLM